MLDRFYEENRRRVPTLARLDANQALEQPVPLREDYVAGAVLEPEAEEIDVAALHQGFLRGLRARGGTLMTEAGVTAFARARGLWHAETPAGAYCAPVVVNAAGAWCDAVAARAGVAPIGLQPKRRTAFIFDGPADGDVDGWPMVHDIDDAFYLKPDAGRILGSPADETPSEPCDVYPEELDIAIGADRIMQATTLDIRHIRNKWAGLRSFVRDRQPVAGFDVAAEGFFWLAGQGGAGIMTAPALGAVTAALVTGEPLPRPPPRTASPQSASAPAACADESKVRAGWLRSRVPRTAPWRPWPRLRRSTGVRADRTLGPDFTCRSLVVHGGENGRRHVRTLFAPSSTLQGDA